MWNLGEKSELERYMLNNHILLGVVWKKSSTHKILTDDMIEILRTLIFRAQLRKKNQLKRLRRNSCRRQSRIKSERGTIDAQERDLHTYIKGMKIENVIVILTLKL